MANNIVRVLDTTVGENGVDQISRFTYINEDKPLKFDIEIGAGDTVVIQGKAQEDNDWKTIESFTEDSLTEIYVMPYWRAIRTIDGGSGDSTVDVVNIFGEDINPHF